LGLNKCNVIGELTLQTKPL